MSAPAPARGPRPQVDDEEHHASSLVREWAPDVRPHGLGARSVEEAARDLALRLRLGGPRYWAALATVALLAGLGVLGLVATAAADERGPARWGYAAATLAFLLSGLQAAPVLAFASRLTRGLWATPLRRLADVFAVVGLCSTPLFFLLLSQVPRTEERRSIWLGAPGTPVMWDTLAAGLLAVTGIVLLVANSVPDLAAARDARPARRGSGWLALGWSGTQRQWRVLTRASLLLGAFYSLLFCFVQVLLAGHLALALVPGWKSPLMGPYHVVTGFQAGIAATIVALALVRRFAGIARHIGSDVFHDAGTLLLAFSALYFYFAWSEVLTLWYAAIPAERWVLGLTWLGPSTALAVLAFLLSCAIPFGILAINPVRRGVAGPSVAAALVLVGSLVDRVRIYSAAWSVAGQHVAEPMVVVPPLPPGGLLNLADVAVLVGGPAAAVSLCLLVLRLLPALALWEYKVDRLLRVERDFIRAEVALVARPAERV